jgi:hypothetical protein
VYISYLIYIYKWIQEVSIILKNRFQEKTINDFPKAAALGQILKDLTFPADKQTIVTFVEKLNTPQSREILPIIEELNEKRYESVAEIANAIRLVE